MIDKFSIEIPLSKTMSKDVGEMLPTSEITHPKSKGPLSILRVLNVFYV